MSEIEELRLIRDEIRTASDSCNRTVKHVSNIQRTVDHIMSELQTSLLDLRKVQGQI